MSPPLNARTLEARTQAIGRELFAAAKREHASLSALNRWTSQVLSWCLSDPAVKANLLRFIDVLPSLDSPRDIVRHVREYFPPGFRLPAALRFGVSLARPAMVTQGALAALIRNLVQQLAGQFIAEATPEGARRVVEALAARGATCSLDLLGEQVLSVAEAEQYVAACGQLVRQSQAAYAALASPPRRCGPLVNLSVKPSALTPRFDPISPSHSVTEAAEKLMPLLRVAVEEGALLNLDMEQYELRDLTLALAKQLLAACPQDRPALGVVIQAYLTDAEAAVEELLAWLAAHERRLTVRVVKGAYWDAEVAQAAQSHWPAPVHQRKTETDAAFERLTERLLQAHPLVTTAVASHNVRSIAHAMATAELLGQPKEQLEFQLLYGMGDALHGAIVERGYPVRIYTPVGALIPGMAYLVRRILENTANESFLRQDFLHERGADELLQPPVASGEIAGPSETAGEWRGEAPGGWAPPARGVHGAGFGPARPLRAPRAEGRVGLVHGPHGAGVCAHVRLLLDRLRGDPGRGRAVATRDRHGDVLLRHVRSRRCLWPVVDGRAERPLHGGRRGGGRPDGVHARSARAFSRGGAAVGHDGHTHSWRDARRCAVCRIADGGDGRGEGTALMVGSAPGPLLADQILTSISFLAFEAIISSQVTTRPS